MANHIRISNPLPGGNEYTSLKAAKKQELRGYGEIIEGTFRFFEHVQERRFLTAAQAAELAEERDITERRNGRFWWNGCRGHDANFPPFCNVVFPPAWS